MAATHGKTERVGGPGLLFVLVALLVVAVVGGRFLGLIPGERGQAPSPARPPQAQRQGQPQVGSTPAVLIYHAHTTENYQPAATHERGKPGGVVTVGDELAAVLEQRGVRAIHDRNVHDYPNYSEAFVHALDHGQRALALQPGRGRGIGRPS
ncbi:MAG: stage II sporulation protein P [Limnochordaceae bacterium]|nr:stage II sporulation protein P [Limnochordaceae bacterium]